MNERDKIKEIHKESLKKNISCVAIDDEPIALEIIKEFCHRYGNIDLKIYSNPIIGIQNVVENKPDILFLDIEMGEISGLDLAKNVSKNTVIIFTTAYGKYAVDGFNLGVVDFLHKPFAYSRFEKAVKKAIKLKQLRMDSAAYNASDEIITVPVEYKNRNIRLSEVYYIESMGNYIRITLSSESSFVLSQMSLKQIENKLPGDKFVRIHKSFIVAIDYIRYYTRTQIIMANEVTLPIGRSYAPKLFEKLKELSVN